MGDTLKECSHEYKKTLSQSGMYFIHMCHKCHDSNPYFGHADYSMYLHSTDGVLYNGLVTAEMDCMPPKEVCKK